jgi:hypothetical protein
MWGTVAANMMALITLQAQAMTSAQNLTRLEAQSCLMYRQLAEIHCIINTLIGNMLRQMGSQI